MSWDGGQSGETGGSIGDSQLTGLGLGVLGDHQGTGDWCWSGPVRRTDRAVPTALLIGLGHWHSSRRDRSSVSRQDFNFPAKCPVTGNEIVCCEAQDRV